MRTAQAGAGIVVVNESVEWLIGGERRTLAKATSSPYTPTGALAVSPDATTAFFANEDHQAARVVLGSGACETFGYKWEDVAYAEPSTLVAAIRDGARLRLVEIDVATMQQRPIVLPEAVRIAWPYGTPYQFGVYVDEDWSASTDCRITATQWGVVVALASGLTCVRWPDGTWVLWRVAFAYQGWICGFCHPDGVVFTSVHNGRTGDIVWVDHNGLWYDAFDSNWTALTPCVPCGQSFVVGVGVDLARFEGYPASIVARTTIGGDWPHDASTSWDASTAVVNFGTRWATILGDSRDVVATLKDATHEEEHLAPVSAPQSETRIPYVPVDDPDLGRLHIPDPAQTAALVDRVRADPSVLQQLVGVPAKDAEDPVVAVYNALDRSPYQALRPEMLISILRRIEADDIGEAMLAWTIRQLLPVQWHALKPTAPVDAWFRDHVVLLVEDEATPGVRRVAVTADVSRTPAWGIRVERDDGREPAWVAIESFEARVLLPSAQIDEEDSWDGLRGEEPVSVSILPTHVQSAFRVMIETEGDGVNAGGLFEPIALEDPAQLRRLYYDADASGLYLGLRGGVWTVDVVRRGMVEATTLAPPEPLGAVRARLEEMIRAEWLAVHSMSRDLLWAVEVAVLGGSSGADETAKALEALLLDHDDVDDLFADTAQLAVVVRELREMSDPTATKAPARPESAAVGSSPLAGMTVCLTGTFARMTRAEATGRCKDAGARVTSSVSSKTDLLVAGEKAGSKLAKAQTLGVRIVDEAALIRLLEA